MVTRRGTNAGSAEWSSDTKDVRHWFHALYAGPLKWPMHCSGLNAVYGGKSTPAANIASLTIRLREISHFDGVIEIAISLAVGCCKWDHSPTRKPDQPNGG